MPDFGRGSQRKFTYLQEVPQVHENRFKMVELPSISSKNVRPPVLTNYAVASEMSFEDKMAARKLRDASIVEYEVNLTQVLPRTKQVPFKPAKFMSELRQVEPEIVQTKRRHPEIDVKTEGVDLYEVNEQTMFALRMKQEE